MWNNVDAHGPNCAINETRIVVEMTLICHHKIESWAAAVFIHARVLITGSFLSSKFNCIILMNVSGGILGYPKRDFQN